jgi:hypothetical protein
VIDIHGFYKSDCTENSAYLLLLSEEHVLQVFENKVVKNVFEFKDGIFKVQVRVFLTCAWTGHYFDCETL